MNTVRTELQALESEHNKMCITFFKEDTKSTNENGTFYSKI